MDIQRHKDKEVQAAIIRLSDALCQWERATDLENILIIRELGTGYYFRAVNGKPNVPDDLSDDFILRRFQQP